MSPGCLSASLLASIFSLSASLIWSSTWVFKGEMINTISFWWNLPILWEQDSRYISSTSKWACIRNWSRNSCSKPWKSLVHNSLAKASQKIPESFPLMQDINNCFLLLGLQFKTFRVHAPITWIKLGIPLYFIDHAECITSHVKKVLSRANKIVIKCFDFGSIKTALRLHLRTIIAG